MELKTGRGGRRPGAGRKPNHILRLNDAARLISRRDPRLAVLTAEELQALEHILRKLRIALLNGPQNQTESNRGTNCPKVHGLAAWRVRPLLIQQRFYGSG